MKSEKRKKFLYKALLSLLLVFSILIPLSSDTYATGIQARVTPDTPTVSGSEWVKPVNSVSFERNKTLTKKQVQQKNGVRKIDKGTTDKSVYQWTEKDGKGEHTYWWSDSDTVLIPDNCAGLFSGCSDITFIDTDGWCTENVTDMSDMFSGCRHLDNVDLSSFDTSNVTDMSAMFDSCSLLQHMDIAGFDTSKVQNMSAMFRDCNSLQNADFSNFNTANVTDMSYMFYGCHRLTDIDVESFNTSKVTDMSEMFSDCPYLEILNVSGFDTSNVENMSNMFYGCESLSAIDVSSWDTGKVTDMSGMFCYCYVLSELDVSNFDMKNVDSIAMMFYSCSFLEKIDVSKWQTGNIKDMTDVFGFCESVTDIDVTGWNTSSAEDMSGMFLVCTALTKLDLSNLIIPEATDLSYFIEGDNLITVKIPELHGPMELGGFWKHVGTSEKPSRAMQSAGTYRKVDIHAEKPVYEARGLGNDNLWEVHTPEDRFRGYCINENKKSPNDYYDKELATEENLVNGNLLSSENYGYKPLGNNMVEALTALVYWQEHGDFYTQQDMWHFTNHYDWEWDTRNVKGLY